MQFPRDLIRFVFVFAIAAMANAAWPPQDEIVYTVQDNAARDARHAEHVAGLLP